jgi:hypothetical protein
MVSTSRDCSCRPTKGWENEETLLPSQISFSASVPS